VGRDPDSGARAPSDGMAGTPTLTEWQGSPIRRPEDPKKLESSRLTWGRGARSETRRTVRRYFEVSGFGHLDRKNPTWGFLNPDLVSVTPILAPRRTNSGARAPSDGMAGTPTLTEWQAQPQNRVRI